MSPKELEQLGNLLLSNVDANVLLALTILEKQPALFQSIQKQALVYYFCTYEVPSSILIKSMKGDWKPLYFITQEGRELTPRELIREWLNPVFEEIKEEQHCLYALTRRNLGFAYTQTKEVQLFPIAHLQKNLKELASYTPFIDYNATWAAYYYEYAKYLDHLLKSGRTRHLSPLELWEYQKVLLVYLRKAQQLHPHNIKIPLTISTLLHQRAPNKLVAQEHAQEIIDNYLMAAFVPDPSQPLSLYVASTIYTSLANFYRDVLQQFLSAHHYYQKSLELAPSYEQAKVEWAVLLKQEGNTEQAQALLETVAINNL